LLIDPATHRLLREGTSGEEGFKGKEGASSLYQLAIVDGAFPECALGIVHSLNVAAFMYIYTVAFYTGSLSLAGNPVAYAVTPHVLSCAFWTLPMHIVQLVAYCLTHVFADYLHWVSIGSHCAQVRLLTVHCIPFLSFCTLQTH